MRHWRMKTKSSDKAPPGLTLDAIKTRFNTDVKARKYIEKILWPHGPVCPHCQNAKPARIWKIKTNPQKKIRAGLYHCAECDREFTVTVGTIFEDTHIPLRKWVLAGYLVCSSKKGMSSHELFRILPLGSYRSRLFMTHRIRHALRDISFSRKMTGV